MSSNLDIRGWRRERPRLAGLLIALTAAVAVFFLWVRPWYLGWGATEEEQRLPLPSDEIVAHPGGQETRAITIARPADEVWPWLAQTGQDRRGFYSYELLENLVGCRMPVSDHLRPDKQAWQLGDKLWMYPPDKAGGAGYATLRAYVPGRVLGFATRMLGTAPTSPEDGGWSFVLVPQRASSTRLLIRGRVAAGRSLLGATFDGAIFEPIHFVMERRMMEGIKAAAEGRGRSGVRNNLQVTQWVATFLLIVLSGVLVFQCARWGRPLAAFLASLAVFQLLTLGQPSPLLGALLVTAVACLLWLTPSVTPALRARPR